MIASWDFVANKDGNISDGGATATAEADYYTVAINGI